MLNRIAIYLAFVPFAIYFLLHVIDIQGPEYALFVFLLALPALALVSLIGVIIKLVTWLKGQSKIDVVWINLYVALVLIFEPFQILHAGFLEATVLLAISAAPLVIRRIFPGTSILTQLLIVGVAWVAVFALLNIKTDARAQEFVGSVTQPNGLVICQSSAETSAEFLSDYCHVMPRDGRKGLSFKVSLFDHFGYTYDIVDEGPSSSGLYDKAYTLKLRKK